MTYRILIAEDNLILQDVVRFNLERAGYDALTAIEGGEALQLIRDQHIDALITDCQMPGMSGLELCRILRDDPQYSRIPILFCTAKGFEIEQQILDDLRLPAIMCKPFSPRELVRRVQELLAESALKAH